MVCDETAHLSRLPITALCHYQRIRSAFELLQRVDGTVSINALYTCLYHVGVHELCDTAPSPDEVVPSSRAQEAQVWPAQLTDGSEFLSGVYDCGALLCHLGCVLLLE